MRGVRGKDETGATYGRWTVLKEGPPKITKTGAKVRRVWAQCICGKKELVHLHNLRFGKSTGCKNEPQLGGRKKGRNTRAYQIYYGMKRRCLDPNARDYARYGGRGISICERWKESFDNFFEDMGECPPGLTLERKNNNKGYSKSNCKWATRLEQQNNMRRNRPLTAFNITLNLSQWARKLDCSRQSIYQYLKSGKSVEDTVDHFLKKRGRTLQWLIGEK